MNNLPGEQWAVFLRHLGWAALTGSRFAPRVGLATYVAASPQPSHRLRTKLLYVTLFTLLPFLTFGGVSALLLSQTQYVATQPTETSVTEKQRPKVPIPDEHSSKVVTPDPVVYKDAAAYISQIEQATTTDSVKVSLNEFGKAYGLTISYEQDPSVAADQLVVTKVTETDLVKVKQFAKLFVQEWSKYPTDWLTSYYFTERPTIVPVITLEAQLDRGREQLGGLYTQDKTRFIYYNIDDITSMPDHDYAWGRGAIHHEAGHAAMMSSANIRQDTSRDADWEATNPIGFIYTTQIDESMDYYHPSSGFVTQYARFSLDEDQAEVFSYVMTDQYKSLLSSWSQSDSYLTQKSELTKKRICATWKKMCGTYYDSFTLVQ